jgi:hypothetical protein
MHFTNKIDNFNILMPFMPANHARHLISQNCIRRGHPGSSTGTTGINATFKSLTALPLSWVLEYVFSEHMHDSCEA